MDCVQFFLETEGNGSEVVSGVQSHQCEGVAAFQMRSQTQGNPNNCCTVTFLSTFHTDANNPEKEGDQKAAPK